MLARTHARASTHAHARLLLAPVAGPRPMVSIRLSYVSVSRKGATGGRGRSQLVGSPAAVAIHNSWMIFDHWPLAVGLKCRVWTTLWTDLVKIKHQEDSAFCRMIHVTTGIMVYEFPDEATLATIMREARAANTYMVEAKAKVSDLT